MQATSRRLQETQVGSFQIGFTAEFAGKDLQVGNSRQFLASPRSAVVRNRFNVAGGTRYVISHERATIVSNSQRKLNAKLS